MKKILIKVGIGVVALIILVAVAMHLFLDSTIKRAIETVGPKMTQTDVEVSNVSLSLLSGSGSIKGLRVGNPEPFKTTNAIMIGSASLQVEPGSVFADKLVIKSIRVESPEITFEGSLKGNNLSAIQENVEEYSSKTETTAPPEEEKAAARKLQVNDLLIANARLNVAVSELGGKVIPVTLSEIHLTNLGTGPEGITAAALAKEVLSEVTGQALQAVQKVLTEAIQSGAVKEVDKAAGDLLEKAGKGVQDLFKRKP